MKQIFSLSAITFLTFALVSTVSAQATSRTPTPARAQDARTTSAEETTPATEEEREARREEFQTKLEEMKDIRKQAMIERIDEKINNFNERHTTKLETGITRMQSVLDGIATKAATLNDTDLDEAIESAQEAIDVAQEAVTAQLEMEYVIDLEDETEVRSAAQEIFTQFRANLQAVHEAVKDAHMAVVKAARLLPKQEMSADDEMEEESTSEAETESINRSSDEEL